MSVFFKESNDIIKADQKNLSNPDKAVDSWETGNNIPVINTDVDSKEALEKELNLFLSHNVDQRRLSDDMSIKAYGADNMSRYNAALSKFNKEPVKIDDIPLSEDVDFIDPEAISDVEKADNTTKEFKVCLYVSDEDKAKNESAKKYMRDTNYSIVYKAETLDELEDAWHAHLTMANDKRILSDNKVIELFGKTNEELYNSRKSEFLALAYPSDKSDETIVKTAALEYMAMGAMNTVVPAVVPMYNPTIMRKLGTFNDIPEDNFYKAESDPDSKELYSIFKEIFNGVVSTDINKYADAWKAAVIDRQKSLKEASLSDLSKIRQSILEMGWDPDIDILSMSDMDWMSLRSNTLKDISSMYRSSEIIDLREPISTFESADLDGLMAYSPHNVYIAIFSSNGDEDSFALNKGTITHIAISLDPNMKTLYDYDGTDILSETGSVIKVKNFDAYSKANNLTLSTVILNDKDYDKLCNNLKNISYDFNAPILTSLKFIKNLFGEEYTMNPDMIFAQLTDRIFKLVSLDIDDGKYIANAKIDDLFSSSINKKIYRLYKGSVSEYNHCKVKNAVARISDRTITVKEAELTAAKRNNLADDEFGIPALRKYPLNDADHVQSAIRLFGHCPEGYEKQLARNIRRAAKKYNVELSDDSKVVEVLNETKYDRPYSPKEIMDNYGKDTFDRLMKDPAHKFRAETGIELIHKEPTKEELDRIWKNWNTMSSSQKSRSDVECIKLFGKTNKDLYYSLSESAELITESDRAGRISIDKNGVMKVGIKNSEQDKARLNAILPYIDLDTYAISDTHSGHLRKEALSVDQLIAKINAANPKSVIFLGDMIDCSDKGKIKAETCRLLNNIKCKKVILIVGNNDILSVDDYYECGYAYVTDRLDVDDCVFTHCPVRVRAGKFNIHGHIHQDIHYYNVPAENHINVSCQYNEHGGRNLREFFSLYNSGYFDDCSTEKLRYTEEQANYYYNYSAIITESKEFPIQFDKDGALLIKRYRRRTVDFQMEYNLAHEVLPKYEEAKNYEGIKYELSKLWFINSMIENDLHNNKLLTKYPDKKKEMTDIRARVVNDFTKYLNVVMTAESNFNFGEYYKTSPFSDVDIKINANTIRYLSLLLKQFI